ncbi:DUF4194 domain-containing protein [Rubritalea marina]|uniref:DUF4194 domain-containing protein n=1 Tax=Rubritalea marina TaxID=361055 RepID=UPI00036B476F|nr:DUF4194 domain-containing protein [Rubritalea marina]
MSLSTSANDTQHSLFNEQLRERERSMLQEIGHRLLAHGSIIRSRNTERPLYDWAVEHLPWVEEWASLMGLKLILQRDERLLMAVPEVSAITRKMKRDETLVALALWYDYDVEVREHGAHEVNLNLREFNEQFQSKFPNLQPLSQSRMKEILRSFARHNLIETDWEDDFSDSTIQILPTLRFAIPFPGIEQWVKTASNLGASTPPLELDNPDSSTAPEPSNEQLQEEQD